MSKNGKIDLYEILFDEQVGSINDVHSQNQNH